MPKKKAVKKKTSTPEVQAPILQPQIRKKRICLDCQKEFSSTGAGNRICRKCARRHKGIRLPSSHHISGGTSEPND